MSTIDIFDFKHLTKAPKATEAHAVDEVIKVFFQKQSFDQPNDGIAIDLNTNELYLRPIIGIRGLRADAGIIQIKQAADVRDVLETYDVLSWDTSYMNQSGEPQEDGSSWELILQFVDGTVMIHQGNEDGGTPKGFDRFVSELATFVTKKKNEIA